MDLQEATVYGHLDHALGNARDAARGCMFDFRNIAKFIQGCKASAEAMRGIGLLRSDETWVRYANHLQPLIDMAMSPGRPTTGDMGWLKIASNLDRVAQVVEQKFNARRVEGMMIQ